MIGCNSLPYGPLAFYPDKVFPQEVEDIKDFMRETFTTDVNGFTDKLDHSSYNNKYSKGNLYYNDKGYLGNTISELKESKSSKYKFIKK